MSTPDAHVSVIVPVHGEPAAQLDAHFQRLQFVGSGLIDCVIVTPDPLPGTDELPFDEGAIASRYGFRRVQIISGADISHRDAIRIGAQASTGDLLTWLNIDDTLLPGAVETVLEAHAAQPGAIIYGKAEQFAADRELGAYPVAREITAEILQTGCFLSQPATWVPRAVWTQLGGLRDTYALAFDHDLWLRAALAGVPFHYIDQPLAFIEVRPEARSFSNRADVLGEHARLQLEYFGRCAPSVLTSMWAETVTPAFGFEQIPAAMLSRAPWWLSELCRDARKRGDVALYRRLTDDMRLWFLAQGVSAEVTPDGMLSDAARITILASRPPPRFIVSMHDAASNRGQVALIDSETHQPCRTVPLTHANAIAFLPDESVPATADGLRRFTFLSATECGARLEALL